IKYDIGYRLEVRQNGHIGYCGTTDFSEDGFKRALNYAKNQTLKLSEVKAYPFSPSSRETNLGRYQSQLQKSFDSLAVSDIQQVLLECSQTMKISESVFSRQASAILVELDEIKLDSLGSEIVQNFSFVNLDLIARAKSGQEIQTRTYNCTLQAGSEIFLRNHLLPKAELMAQQSLQLLEAIPCPSEKTDVVLAPDQMSIHIHETVGHPLEIDRILGDERNYAGWSFVKLEDFGKLQYGSSKMNILFEPHRFSEMASYNFDDSGLKAEKKYLIKEGLLLQGLGGLESQERSQQNALANFRSSSWNRAPIDRMANLNLAPGQLPLEDMIKKIEKGIIMLTNRSWSIDDYRRKFQFGCEFGQLIEDGQLTKIVKNPNYHGISVPFWHQLEDVSQENEVHGSFYCGKGEPNQVIRTGHASPFAWFKNIEIF
ncbi:MAG: TldD/PmbA family protein, partial [Bdellovibrionales bacterium]|nr:TldD/PmbA family protein [Bdellovibrionales bacterium]